MNTKKIFLISFSFVLLLLLLYFTSCKKDDNDNAPTVTLPVVTTANISNIASTTAVCGGTVTTDGGSNVTERGICWNTSQNPTISDNKSTDGSTGTGTFTANLSGLTGGTTYYVRAYAMNSAGVAYGNEKTFTTQTNSDFAFTLAATNVRFNKATLNGTINPNNISTEVFFEYGTTTSYGQTVTILQNPCSGNNDIQVSVDISGLLPITTYHFRIKTTNFLGTTFGDDMTFKTNYLPGDSTLGGIIFYVDNTGEHGFVVDSINQGSFIKWNNGTNILTNASGTALGTGENNTQTIVNVQGTGNYAASLCYNLNHNSYSNWFLPSTDELQLVHSIVGLPTYAYYWTSTEIDSSTAKLVHITNLNYFGSNAYHKSDTVAPGYTMGETLPINVRSIRAF